MDYTHLVNSSGGESQNFREFGENFAGIDRNKVLVS
jgi:hypothetical protein